MNKIISCSNPAIPEQENLLYFDFRLHTDGNGNQIIQTGHRTFLDSLTPSQMLEYMTVHEMLLSQKRIQLRQERSRRSNLLWKIACLCGII